MYYDFLYQSNADGTEGFCLCYMGISSPSSPFNVYVVWNGVKMEVFYARTIIETIYTVFSKK